jgi:hypothetical protein
MKVKVKFDLASVKSWLFEHGEKVAFGLMVVVFLLFSYSAAQREVLDDSKQPDKLKSVADRVTSHVASSPWKADNPEVQLVNYQARAKRDEVRPEDFAITEVWNRPIVEAKGKREDPEIFNAEQIQVSAGTAPFAFKGAAAAGAGQGTTAPARPTRGQSSDSSRGFAPSGNSKLEPQSWVVITALVPVEKQAAEYERVFSQSQGGNPQRDTPKYLGKIVERAEFDPKQPDKLDWQPLKPLPQWEQRWEGTMSEMVDARYIEPVLADPLGPKVGEDWPQDLVGHPSLAVTAVNATAKAAPAATASEGEGAAAAENTLTPERAAEPAAPAAPAARPMAASTGVAHKLLRIFDYSVKPGRKYRYRLKLALENPNFGLHPRFLKNPGAPESKESKRFAKQWSEPTPVVTVPEGFGVLAGSVEAAREPWAKLLLTAIKPDGVVAAAEVRVQRGSVANKREKVEAIDPRDQSSQPMTEVDFKSRMVVVDIFGGKLVSGPRRRTNSPISAPGEVLLLDAGGNLIVHNDLEDLDDYEFRLPPKPEVVDEDTKDKDKKDKDKKDKDKKDEESPRRARNSTARAGR